MSARGGTLLAKMGFRDSDRADPMHDAACAYVAANAKKVYAAMTGRRVHSAKVKQEDVVSKGSAQYKTTIGFIDLVIRAEVWVRESRPKHRYDEDAWASGVEFGLLGRTYCGDEIIHHVSVAERGDTILGVEVKWTEKCVSDAIRQIAVYRSFAPENEKWIWALATPHTLNIEQKAALDSNGFKYIRLSEENVRAFAAQQRALPAESEMTL